MILLSRSTLWFAAVGVVNTGVYYLLYLLLHTAGVDYLVAHLTATLIAMVGSYFLNCRLTFGIRPSWRTFLLFPLSNLANIVITTVGMKIVVATTSIDERIAPLPVAVLAIPITYLVTHYLLVGRWSTAYSEEAAREAGIELTGS